MPRTANINLRIAPNVRADAQALFSNFGMSVTDEINIFLHQSLIVGGLPFEVRQPRYNATTEKAMDEAKEIISGKKKAKTYSSLSEILEEIDD